MERFEVKTTWTASEDGEIIGLASIFGTEDLGGDVVHRGAFKSARPPIPMLASHDQADVVGVWEALEEVAEGLKVKGRLLVAEVARAREVQALIRAGAMGGLSIGYIAKKAARRASGIRDLREVILKEISVVAVPMHPQARIIAAKSTKGGAGMDPEELETKLKEIDTKASGAADLVAKAVAPLIARLDAVEAKSNRATGGGSDDKEPTEERKAFGLYLRRGNLAPETELKALTLSSDPNGGYLAPPEFSGEVLRDIVEMSPIRSVASIRGTNAPSVIYSTRKPMGNATWDDELDEETETGTTNIFGTGEVVVKGMSTFVDVSNMLLQDAGEVETEVRSALVEDFAKKESVAFVNGNGVIQPEGFMQAAGVAEFNNGHAANIQPDALINFLYSISPYYRNGGVWVMNGATLGKIRVMKDGQGNYLWQPSYQAGQPEMILGRPVLEVIDMPDIAANAFPICYADFSGYRILDRLAMSILVDPYSRATQKQTRYHAGRRVGGKVLQPIKFKKLKMAV